MSQPAMSPEDRRKRLLEAAERCFIASGFHGARMAQIASEARMSPGHIYHYFESKEQIIAELVRAHAEEKRARLQRFEEAGDRVVDFMIEKLDASVDANTDPFWSTLMLEITAEATRNPEIAATLRDMDRELKNRLLNCLGASVQKSDLDARLEVLIAILQGIGIRNIINPDLDRAAIVDLVREIAGVLFRPERETGA